MIDTLNILLLLLYSKILFNIIIKLYHRDISRLLNIL
jgi:hypothetical protein